MMYDFLTARNGIAARNDAQRPKLSSAHHASGFGTHSSPHFRGQLLDAGASLESLSSAHWAERLRCSANAAHSPTGSREVQWGCFYSSSAGNAAANNSAATMSRSQF